MATVVKPNSKNIIRAIQQIALTQQSFVNGESTPYLGSKIYAPPTKEQVEASGTPFFSVGRPRMVGYAQGGEIVNATAARGIQMTEPVWEYEIFAFHPYDPNYPSYDDAEDDVNGLWEAYMNNLRLPFTSAVDGAQPLTTTSFNVMPGDGVRFRPYRTLTLNGAQNHVVLSVDGDTITLAFPLETPPSGGWIVSQETCDSSFPFNVMPDYAELSDGSPWCVGYLVIRAFEQLLTTFP